MITNNWIILIIIKNLWLIEPNEQYNRFSHNVIKCILYK